MPQTFNDHKLDKRVLRALKRLGISTPTEIQEKTLSKALRSKNIVAHAPTGSGKTLVYAVPLVQQIAECSQARREVFAAVLAPTQDLCAQIATVLRKLLKHFDSVDVLDLCNDELDTATLRICRQTVVTASPKRLLPLLESRPKLLQHLQIIVFDEADVLFVHPRVALLQKIIEHIPCAAQSFCIAATKTPEASDAYLRLLPKHRLLEIDTQNARATHLKLGVAEREKLLATYAIVKTPILSGRMLFFANSTEKAYRLFLFLRVFGVSVCLINPELPLNTRTRTMAAFNRNEYSHAVIPDPSQNDDHALCRGIDFKRVDVVFNFDLPSCPETYIHRAGRTARGTEAGTVFSFFTPHEHNSESIKHASPLALDSSFLSPFSYRVKDVLARLTPHCITEFRKTEIRKELLQAQNLQAHFSQNTHDLEELSKEQAVSYLPQTIGVAEYLHPPSH